MKAQEILQSWSTILGGRKPLMSIEITRECPLRCPGCYAYDEAHLGGNGVTLRVLSDNRVYYKRGTDPWARSDIKDLADVFKLYKGNKDLVVVIKIDRESKFSGMVDIIDDLDLASLTRFSLGTLEDAEKKEVASL